MNKGILFILEVLRNMIFLDDNIVPVIKRNYPLDKTPCITLDDSGGSSTLGKELLCKDLPLSPNHPQYDPENPNKLSSQQVLRTKHNTTINLNLWCSTENEREELCNQILLQFNKAFTDHYTYCGNYDKYTCSYLGTDCEAINNQGTYGIKGQCPHKQEYRYSNLFSKYKIPKKYFVIEDPFSMDDLTCKPRLLRSIFKIRLDYYTDYVIGGIVADSYEYTGG